MTLFSGEPPNVYICIRQPLKRTTFSTIQFLAHDITAKVGHMGAWKVLLSWDQNANLF